MTSVAHLRDRIVRQKPSVDEAELLPQSPGEMIELPVQEEGMSLVQARRRAKRVRGAGDESKLVRERSVGEIGQGVIAEGLVRLGEGYGLRGGEILDLVLADQLVCLPVASAGGIESVDKRQGATLVLEAAVTRELTLYSGLQ